MKKSFFFIIFFYGSLLIHGQTPAIQWQKSLGGTGQDYGQSIQQTTDRGYIIVGYSNSNDGEVTGNHGLDDYWVVKTDSLGGVQWQKSLGGTGTDYGYSVQLTSDRGYIIAGESDSNNGNVSGNHGGNDYWIVKIDSLGSLQWQKCLGGTGDDIGYFVQPTADGGYIVTGESNSTDGNITGNHGNYDYWIVKLDNSGTIQWQKCLGGTAYDYANYSIKATIDGGYIVTGDSYSNNGDVSGNHGGADCWVVKLDSLGIIQWQKSLGGTGHDYGFAIQPTADGGYIISGATYSNNGNVSGNHGAGDCWVVKLNSLGIMQWQKCLGGTAEDLGYFIYPTADNGYIVTGYSYSINGDMVGNHGNADYWVVKLDSLGSIQWQKPLGGTGTDNGYSIQPTMDGGYIVAGASNSNNGNVTGNHGLYDFWVVKLDANSLGIEESKSKNTASISVSPNPSTGQFKFNRLVENTNGVEENTITIYDITGRSIYQIVSKNNSQMIDLSQKNKGVYFYKIINSKKTVQQGKIILQ